MFNVYKDQALFFNICHVVKLCLKILLYFQLFASYTLANPTNAGCIMLSLLFLVTME